MESRYDYSGPERRAHKRVKASFIITYTVRNPFEVRVMTGDRNISALMADMSEGGVAMITEQRLPASAVLSMSFTLLDKTSSGQTHLRNIKTLGEVRHTSALTEKEYRLGIRFTNISAEDRKSIANFVQERLLVE
jgi:c-di-GMP-binding flagellar brake protein YcgR